ncbi:response regulator transcription factor [bacterium]|nr:response regulator transcription factor [bacterium]
MPTISGMEAAREIRNYDKVAKIVFLTSSPEFAVGSYSVGAFYYALKPICKEKLFAILDKVFTEIHDKNQSSILVKSKTGLSSIPLHLLEYVEISGRTISYHLANGIILQETGVMSKLQQKLSAYPEFVTPHRAFIVNLDYIDVLTHKEIKLYSNARIPVAKTIYKDLKAVYITRTFQRGGKKTCLLP